MDVDLERAVSALRNLPGLTVQVDERVVSDPSRHDATITVSTGAGVSKYFAEVKRGVTTTTLSAVLAQLERGRRSSSLTPLLISHRLSPAVSKELMKEGVEFVDGAGNVFLNSSAAYVVALGKTGGSEPRAAGLTAADLQLVFALLAKRELRRATYRTINRATGLSLGKISAALRKLESAGHVRRTKSGSFFLPDPPQLLERWEFGYLEQLRNKLAPSKWRIGPKTTLERVRDSAVGLDHVLLGSEYAADALTTHLHPDSLTLHVPPGMAPSIAAHLRLTQAKERASVVMLDRFVPLDDNLEMDAIDIAPEFQQMRLAHPILIRAELLAQNDSRLRAVADIVLNEQILNRLNDALT
jgi:hypothetical protein